MSKEVKELLRKENLKVVRLQKGLTQSVLAEKAGITQMHYSAIERGDKNPSLETLEAILTVLDIPIEDVWLKDLNPPQPPTPDGQPQSPESGEAEATPKSAA
jgi:transcriptional regulator with XRE-family HTH domain